MKAAGWLLIVTAVVLIAPMLVLCYMGVFGLDVTDAQFGSAVALLIPAIGAGAAGIGLVAD